MSVDRRVWPNKNGWMVWMVWLAFLVLAQQITPSHSLLPGLWREHALPLEQGQQLRIELFPASSCTLSIGEGLPANALLQHFQGEGVWLFRAPWKGVWHFRVSNPGWETVTYRVAFIREDTRETYDALRAYRRAQVCDDFACFQANLEQAASIWQEMGLLNQAGYVCRELGAQLKGLGDFGGAQRMLGRAEALYCQADNDLDRADTMVLRGQVTIVVGELARACDYLEEAATVANLRGDVLNEALAHFEWGRASEYLGKNLAALEHFERAERLWGSLKRGRFQMISATSRAYSLSVLGRHRDALEILEDVLRYVGDDRVTRGNALLCKGWAHLRLGDIALGIELMMQARNIYPPSAAYHRGMAWERLGLAFREVGALDDAVTSLERALELASRPDSVSKLRCSLGLVLCEAGERERAAEQVQTVRQQAESSGNQRDRFNAEFLEARLCELRGETLQALTRYRELLTRVEAVRAEASDPFTRMTVFANYQEVMAAIVDLYMELHEQDPEEGYALRALAFIESFRGRGLYELRREGESTNSLLDQLNQAEAQYPRSAKEKRAALNSRANELTYQLKRAEAVETNLVPTLSLEAIQARLDDGDLLLVYGMGRQFGYAWAVSCAGVEVSYLPEVSLITQKVEAYMSAVSARPSRLGQSRVKQWSRELAQLVLPRIGSDVRRLLISADGILYGVPLGSLSQKGEDPLISRLSVAYLPTMTVLEERRRQRADADEPHMTLASIAPTDATRTRDGRVLPKLDGAIQEALAISEMVAPDKRLELIGDRANTSSVVSSDLGDCRYIHVATHGQTDPARPEFSALVLSEDDQEKTPDLLYAYMIRRMQLKADLVTLSACGTAAGSYIAGEGRLSLGYAFLEGGARAVVVSHWNIDDQATADLMRLFYRKVLTEGRHPASALREAQLALYREGLAPHYWAGFSLLGDYR